MLVAERWGTGVLVAERWGTGVLAAERWGTGVLETWELEVAGVGEREE